MGNSPIVARINSLLAEKGIPKQEFYKDCHITSASYSLWNTCKTTPRQKNLETIAEYLNVTVEYLQTGFGQKNSSPPTEVDGLDEETMELREIWDTSDADERQTLLEMARLIKKRRDK